MVAGRNVPGAIFFWGKKECIGWVYIVMVVEPMQRSSKLEATLFEPVVDVWRDLRERAATAGLPVAVELLVGKGAFGGGGHCIVLSNRGISESCASGSRVWQVFFRVLAGIVRRDRLGWA